MSEETRSTHIGRYLIRGNDQYAQVGGGQSGNYGEVYEIFDNTTTTDASEPSAFERAKRWAKENP